jgi:hypothetical protein
MKTRMKDTPKNVALCVEMASAINNKLVSLVERDVTVRFAGSNCSSMSMTGKLYLIYACNAQQPTIRVTSDCGVAQLWFDAIVGIYMPPGGFRNPYRLPTIEVDPGRPMPPLSFRKS